MVRLDKFLSDSGAGTRSQVKLFLRAGRVTVDGASEKDGGRKIDPLSQTVTLDGTVLGGYVQRVILLNKPAGFVTATSDPAQQTVMALLPPEYADLKPVGRLDKETEGLLLLTDDGDLLHRLISPKNRVPKLYYARHQGSAGPEDVAAFRAGLTLGDGYTCLPACLEPLCPGESLITVCEGKYHQVRRMMAARGLTVSYLERRGEGPLTLGTLRRGESRPLTAPELDALEAIAGKSGNLMEK